MTDFDDSVSSQGSLSGSFTTSEVTGSNHLSHTSSVLFEPLSAEMLVSLIRPRICWEAAQDTLAGPDALSMIPEEWEELVIKTFNPGVPPAFDFRDISSGLRTLYVEPEKQTTPILNGHEQPTASSQNDTHVIEASLATADAAMSLKNTLDALPRWVEECYLPLLRCAFSSNDLIEDVSVHLPSPPGERLCDAVFRDEALAVLRTETAHVPAAIRLSKETLNKAVPVLPSALASAQSSQLSPRYCNLGQTQHLELFSTLIDWHPHHLGIRYQDNANAHPGLWCHGRMAAISPTRHLHWLGIKAPVMVVQFDFEKVSFHVNWPRIVGERLCCTSAPVWPPNSTRPHRFYGSLLKSLDRRKPAGAVEVGLILSNLDRYTSGYFLEQAARRFSEGDFYQLDSRPWKIDVSSLPTSMTEVEGSRQWYEERERYAERSKVPEDPPDIRAWLETVC